jgi:hypothetical protein
MVFQVVFSVKDLTVMIAWKAYCGFFLENTRFKDLLDDWYVIPYRMSLASHSSILDRIIHKVV